MTQKLKKILCIDDEQDILKIAMFSLERIGHFEVETCRSGADAVARVQMIGPDIILLDVMMPGMDGFETFKNLHQMPALTKTPVIFMTAKVQPTEVDSYKQMGIAGVIAKPFDPIALPEVVTEFWKLFHAGDTKVE
jgi:CheY-like chemotaxis protein